MEGRVPQRGPSRQLPQLPLTAARNGEPFSVSTGRPISCKRDEPAITWYALTLDYTAAKWPYAAPNHRRSIAEALTDATEAMLAEKDPPYAVEEIRRALRTWAFSDRLRGAAEPPDDLTAVIRWLQTATLPVADLSRRGPAQPAAGPCSTGSAAGKTEPQQPRTPPTASAPF